MTRKHRLELMWPDKEKWESPESRILLEKAVYKSSKTGVDNNLLIYGDNLLGLKALERSYIGKVKCIYIDPPYNTKSIIEHYQDNFEHSLWLNMMKERLIIMWKLLHPKNGSLWISIDDREMAYLKILLDETCGRHCFIASNIWQKRYSRENRQAIGDVHEYVLVYAKDPLSFKAQRNKIPLTSEQSKVYRNPNNDPKGPWRSVPITAQAGHATAEQFYEITAPSGKVFTPSEGRCWGMAKRTFEKLRTEGKIYFGKNGDSQPNLVRYLSEVEGVAPWTWWPSEEVGHTDEAKKEQHLLFGKNNAFDTPKPERLIERILHIATNPGDLVLDSFAGSGTTGAVAHKMGRRWIMIELNPHCHTHIVPRLQKVIDGADQGGITEAVEWKGGGSFRLCELAPSLLERNRIGRWVISKKYNPIQLAEAVCLHAGFQCNPKQDPWWVHGQSTERDFIYVTSSTLTSELLKRLSEEVGEDRTLLVYCEAFHGKSNEFPNLTIEKIPKKILTRCEWGRDDYSLKVQNALKIEAEAANSETHPKSTRIRVSVAAKSVRRGTKN